MGWEPEALALSADPHMQSCAELPDLRLVDGEVAKSGGSFQRHAGVRESAFLLEKPEHEEALVGDDDPPVAGGGQAKQAPIGATAAARMNTSSPACSALPK